MQQYTGKRVTVMGIGLHGGAVETIQWFLKKGARVVATDLKRSSELAPSLEKLKGLKNLTIVTGIHRVEDFTQTDLIVKNPAVRWDNEYVQLAFSKKIPVEMDASLFFQECKSKKIIGITGTKGKTTTALLIYEILKKAGEKVVLVGVGQEGVMGKLKIIDEKTWVVFELSSWRLSALKRKKVSPFGAVVVNLLQDHLNYYHNMAEYAQDKKAIFEFQKETDWLVIDGENFIEDLWLTKKSALKQKIGYFSEKGNGLERNVYLKEGKISFFWEGKSGELGAIQNLRLRGKHNQKNVLAAVSAGLFLQVKPEVIWSAVSNFAGAPHRLELVRELNGIKFYNDTAATTPEAGIKGIQSFQEDIHLIAGGSNKNLNLEGFAREIAENPKVRKVYFLNGSATEGLKNLVGKLGGEKKIAGIFESIEEAVAVCRKEVLPNDIVLLSPGCASFGMFQNEFDRGEKFCQAVRKLG